MTEPWTQNLLAALVQAIHAKTVLELGCFKGITTAMLALQLEQMGGGDIIAVDCNQDYCDETMARISELHLQNTGVKVYCDDAISAIHSLDDYSIDFAFVDDKIDARHIHAELEALWSWYDAKSPQKMSIGGLIAVHDVTHDDVASAVIGHQGYILNTARMHLHGGLGLIQIPSK